MKTRYLKAKTGLLLLLVALLLGASLPASAQKKVYIGSGSGELNYPNAQATLNLQDGDTLVIRAGVYQGITLNNITAGAGKKIYVINQGQVEITNSWVGFNVSDLTNVDIMGNGTPGITYGFYIHDLLIRGMDILGRLSGVSFSYFRMENMNDYGVYMLDNALIYDGTNNSLFYDIKFLHFKMYNIVQTPFQFGDWSLVKDLGAVGMMRKIEVAYCDVEKILNADIIHLNRAVQVNVHHNRIVHTGLNDTRHAGIIYLRGDGDIHHNYISDHWGNGVRAEGFSLDAPGTVNIYNNVVVNSRKYSGVEANSYDNDVNGSVYTRYCNYKIYNNTFGNLSAADWQAAMVDTYNAYGGTIEIKNNIGFNIQKDLAYDATRNYVYSRFNVTLPDTANNLYSTSYVPLGLINDSSCLLNVNSPAIDKGTNFSWMTDDIDGVARPQNGIFDIGAHEYQSGVIFPVANAGGNISIVLPQDSVKLAGTASYNPGGGVLSYAWSVTGGPASYAWSGDTTATPTLRQLAAGVYQVKLVVTNSSGKTNEATITVTVNAAPPPPVANAGTDINITLPTNSTALNGNGSSNPTGGALTYSWAQVAGPSAATISNGGTATPTVGNLVEGSYQLALTVTNTNGITAKDTVVITVNPAPPPGSQPPVANAGADANITLPASSVGLDGSASYEPGGGAITYAWTVTSGPAGYAISGAGTATPTLSGLTQGTYQVSLTVTNSTGLTNTDLVEITVNPQPGPVAIAGNNIVITLPTSTATLDGSASYQPGGGSFTYAWTITPGPSTPAITGANTATPTLSALVQGTYQVTLTITNASGGTAVSSVTVTVNAAISPNPVANAGGSKSMTLPDNSATLDGSASYNPAGGSLTYAWSKIAGPGAFAISGATTAKPVIGGLSKGVYQVGLTVTNAQGLTATDIISITVNPGLVPVAKTGADTTVNFPKGFALLDGSASYALGGATITGYSWRQVSGPTYVLFGNDSMPNTSVGNLEPGDYVIELTVTDSKGLTGSTRVKISVVNTFRNNKIITLYPNPCTTQVNVHLISDATGPLTIRITSTSGVIVYTQAFQKSQLQFDQLIPTGSLPSGMYVMEVIIGSQVQLLQKFIKQ